MRPFVDATEEPWSPQHEARLQRLRRLSRVLDAQWLIPGTRYRVGLDGLVGLIPGVGDAAGALLSTYILYEALRLGAPRWVLLRMAANIGLETLVGALPVVGDLLDVVWKANTKNVALLQAALAARRTNRGTAEQTPATGVVRPTDVAGRRG
jgi:hypothetical protein